MNDLIADIRQKVPNIGLRTTLIVGYPGETEEDFQILKYNELYKAVEPILITFLLHVYRNVAQHIF